MKLICSTLLLLTFIYSQCDSNNDGNLDVFDIVEQVNCILDGCWNSEEDSIEIFDYWMIDSMTMTMYVDEFPIQNLSIYCNDSDTASVMNFNEDGYAYQYPIESVYCAAQEVALPDTFLLETFMVSGDSLTIFNNDEGDIDTLEFVYEIEGNSLMLSATESLEDIMEGAVGNTNVYFHKVTILGVQNSNSISFNKNHKLNYMNRRNIDRMKRLLYTIR